MIKRIQRNVLYWWIFLKGPVDVLNSISKKKKVYHKCEACYLLERHKKDLRKLASKKEEIFSNLKMEIYGVQDYLLRFVKE